MKILEAGRIQILKPGDVNFLAKWEREWNTSIKRRWNPERVLAAAAALSHLLKTNEAIREKLALCLTEANEASSQLEAWQMLSEVSSFLERANLERKLFAEFGELDPFSLRKVRGGQAFEAWAPLGLLVHILPGNAPTLPFLAAVEGLLTGNTNVIKLSSTSGSFSLELLALLAHEDPSGEVASRLFAAPISSKNTELLKSLFAKADGISAWGGEEAIAALQALAPPNARFLAWGHKLSFAYVTQSQLNEPGVEEELARSICNFDQQACSSPQCIFLETDSWTEIELFCESLAKALARISPTIPARAPEDAEAAEITKVVNVHKAESCLRPALTIEADDKSWRILADLEPGLRASPLFRTIFVKPMLRAEIVSCLRPLRTYLQTVGLVCAIPELAEMTQILENCGVQRVRAPSKMLDGYAGEPHDGVYALERFSKRISLELPALEAISDFSELEIPTSGSGMAKRPLLTKEGFQHQSPNQTHAELFFKSGGSSGEPKISTFSYDDYHVQMRHAADGLVAAGLDPANDRCMNLFYAGGLYGGFLSFFTILEELRAKQFPMAAHLELGFVGKVILDHKVNVLLGMPSFLELLFHANDEAFRKARIVQKIFYGGEHFTQAQKQKFRDRYGVEIVRSATYGSVDAGPLGYQCPHCDGSVHHLHTALQELEILHSENDQPAPSGQPGRLIFTSKRRTAITLDRYEIGDLGRWVPGACPCGRASPRFELLGRYGDVFRVGGAYLNYNTFQRILDQDFRYPGEFQIEITKHENIDRLVLRTDNAHQLNAKALLQNLMSHYADFAELVSEGTLTFQHQAEPSSNLERISSSGKLRRIVDRR